MTPNPSFRLGDWLVQPDLNRITGRDGEVRLEPRVMAVLVRLAEAGGEVVRREVLLDEVWEGTFVGEESLTRTISDLRRAFGDDPRRPDCVETIRRKGYRLLPQVQWTEVNAEEPPPEPPRDTPPPETNSADTRKLFPPRLPRKPFRPWGTLASLAVIAAIFLGRALLLPEEGRPPTDRRIVAEEVLPLTTYPGHERQPALSPDGTRVAFAWDGHAGDANGIWVKQRNSETPLQLGGGRGRAAWPVWSPDAQTVAWVQVLGDSSEIRSVPSLGGATRTLHATAGLVAGLDWHPVHDELVFSRPVGGGHRLARLDLTTLGVTDLGGDDVSCVHPRFAPRGDRLACVTHSATSSGIRVTTADADRQLVNGLANIHGLAWTADGKELVYAAEHAGMFHLWRVDADGGAARRLAAAGDFAWNPAIAARTGDLAWEQVRVDQDLWRIRVRERDPWQVETERFLASTRWEYEADYSPDGTRLAFVSARSGTPELWLCDRDGGNPRRLTNTGGDPLLRPRWSPDGTRLAFNILADGRTRIMIVAAAGGAVSDLTPAGEDEVVTGWSPDGVAVEFLTGQELRRRPVDGGDFLVVQSGVAAARRDTDGTLFVVPADRGDVIRGGGTEVTGLDPVDRHNWAVAGGVVFWVLRAGDQAFLMVHDPDSGREDFVADLPAFAGTGLAVSPAGDEVISARSGSAEGDLMLLPARELLR